MAMRRPTIASVAVLLILGGLAVPSGAQEQSADTYVDLLEAAKRGQANVDYEQLRAAFALTEGYQPYGMYLDDLQERAREAVSERDLDLAVARVETMLEAAYPSLETQYWAAFVYQAAGDSLRSQFHEQELAHLYEAALSTGDGSSVHAPITVLYTGEEYLILQVLRKVDVLNQSIEHAGGHSFDRMGVRDRSTGDKTDVYFNIDALVATWSRMFDR